jgi:hypothetical protein
LLIEKNRRIFDKRQFGSLRKEEIMEAAEKDEKENASSEGKKEKRKWRSGIRQFIVYGGWMLVVAAIIAIIKLCQK